MAAVFPDDYTNPKKKGKKWTTEVAKSIYSEWDSLGIDSFCKGAKRYKENREYSIGKNSVERHKEAFRKSNDPSSSWANIDFKPLPILPKFRRIVNDKHAQMVYDIQCDAIDPVSMSERRSYESMEEANIKLRDDLAPTGIDTSVLDSGEIDQPKTLEELAMKMEFSYKHNSAIEIEKRINLVFNENRIHDYIMPQVRRDLFECGVAVTKDQVDTGTGAIKVRRVRPENYGCSPFINEDGSDITYHFEIIYLSPLELIKRCGDIDEDDVRSMINKSISRTQSSKWLGDATPYEANGRLNDQMRIPVLEFEYKTIDRHVYEVGEKNGMPLTSRADSAKYGKDGYFSRDNSCWRKGSWVIGTDYSFDFGAVEHQVVNGDEAISSFNLYAPELLDMETWSVVDQLKPIVDRIQFAWFKLDNIIKKARPKGIIIEISSLEDIDLGTDEEMTPLDIIDLFDQSGNLVYRRTNLAGEYANGKPIDELQNGIGSEAHEWFGVLANYFSYIREILGVNELTDGSTPAERTGKKVAEMANAATSNAIFFLLRAETSLYERLAMSVAIRVEDAIYLGLTDHYKESLGAQHIKSMNEENEQVARTYGYMIIEAPSGEQKQMLMSDMMIAVQNKEITMAEKVIIENIPNIKHAQQRLAYAVKQRYEQIQRDAQKNMELQTKQIVEQTKAGSEAKEREYVSKGNAEIARERVIGEENRKTLEHKYRMERLYGVGKSDNTTGERGSYNKHSSRSNESKNDRVE